MPAVAGKQPDCRFPAQTAIVVPQHFQQVRAEHDIAIFAAFASLDMDHHALTVDVRDLQMRQFGTPQASGIQGHQESAVETAWARHRSAAKPPLG